MRTITFNYVAIKKIKTPFPLNPVPINDTSDNTALFTTLFSNKAYFFRQKNHRLLSITLLPGGPFGPDMEVLRTFLFADFQKAVTVMKEKWSFDTIEIVGLDARLRWNADGIRFVNRPGKNSLLLSLIEFSRLHGAIVNAECSNTIFVSFFVDFEHLFCFCVSQGTPLKDIVSGESFLVDYIRKYPDRTACHPLTGKIYDMESGITDYENNLVCFSGSGYICAPQKKNVFVFPYFISTVSMEKGSGSDKNIVPCNNCLRCRELCPSRIYPNIIFHLLENGASDEALALNMQACIRCGLCSFVCPSNLPICTTITDACEQGEEVS